MQHRDYRIWLLSAFSVQGGIERFNRAMICALYKLQQKRKAKIFAEILYDQNLHENNYAPLGFLNVYKGRKLVFFLNVIRHLFKNETCIIGHLNLSIIGYLKKLTNPSSPLIVICHGLEVFQPLKGVKKKILKKADLILAVSTYTKSELILKQKIAEHKILLFPNTLDPFFDIPISFGKPSYLKSRYNVTDDEKVLLTIARMSSKEGYKGYDQVLRTIPFLLQSNLRIKYLLCGNTDLNEKKRIINLITELGIESHVILTGFIDEKELADHYLLSDVFVMPSKGEGFGIVYLEAMACGREVVAGNVDGSTEALQFGKLGTLVNPDDLNDLRRGIQKAIITQRDPTVIQQNMLEHFSFKIFEKRTSSILNTII